MAQKLIVLEENPYNKKVYKSSLGFFLEKKLCGYYVPFSGSVDTINEIRNIQEVLGKLCAHLREKNILSNEELFDIFNIHQSDEKRYTIKEKEKDDQL